MELKWEFYFYFVFGCDATDILALQVMMNPYSVQCLLLRAFSMTVAFCLSSAKGAFLYGGNEHVKPLYIPLLSFSDTLH